MALKTSKALPSVEACKFDKSHPTFRTLEHAFKLVCETKHRLAGLQEGQTKPLREQQAVRLINVRILGYFMVDLYHHQAACGDTGVSAIAWEILTAHNGLLSDKMDDVTVELGAVTMSSSSVHVTNPSLVETTRCSPYIIVRQQGQARRTSAHSSRHSFDNATELYKPYMKTPAGGKARTHKDAKDNVRKLSPPHLPISQVSQALARDNFRCVVTKAVDLNSAILCPDIVLPGESTSPTQCCHILSQSTVDVKHGVQCDL
jgi:hypothetical protein